MGKQARMPVLRTDLEVCIPFLWLDRVSPYRIVLAKVFGRATLCGAGFVWDLELEISLGFGIWDF